ncbi:hypothetical protein GCM10023196_037560 [Actinoallomurus vinaceus]|uniref:HNH endonuclease n=1 Tax=Actinoallomurus vinaceus TaxID=1080074 RepID=A0ABP8U9F8_9ACTN
MISQGNRLRPKRGCGTKSYPDEAAALRALDRIKTRNTRSKVPTRAEECPRGLWHLVGGKATGTGPADKIRALILERDGHRCASCGTAIRGRWYSLQHRNARGMGGTSDPLANSPVNLITLCVSATSPGCHLACERRHPDMHEAGFWLWDSQDPTAVPVTHAIYGRVLLLPDCAVQPVTPTGGDTE